MRTRSGGSQRSR